MNQPLLTVLNKRKAYWPI